MDKRRHFHQPRPIQNDPKDDSERGTREGGNRTLLWFTLVLALVTAAMAVAAYLKRPARAVPEAATAVAIVAQPIPRQVGGRTVADEKKENRAFFTRVWTEGYEKRADRGTPKDAEYLALLNAYVDSLSGDKTPADPDFLRAESERIARDLACSEPLVLTVAALHCANLYDRQRMYQRALELYPQSRHLAYPQLFAAARLMGESKEKYDQEGELNVLAKKLIPRCFQDGSFTPEEQGEVAQVFIERWAEGVFSMDAEQVCDAVHGAGPGYKWLSLVLDGQRHIRDAWNARGGGYSDSVSPDAWHWFYKNLALARYSLVQAWDMDPKKPLPAERMMYVALGDTGVAEMKIWFNRALKAQIDYTPAWTLMRWGLRARWYGNPKSQLELGKQAVETGRFDTYAPFELIRCVWDTEADLGVAPGSHIYADPQIWPLLVRMFEGYIADPERTEAVSQWRSYYAAVAYMAGKLDVARAQLVALDWKFDTQRHYENSRDLSLMPPEVAALTGGSGAAVAVAEADAKAGRAADALKAYGVIAAEAKNPRTKSFAGIRADQLQRVLDLKAGKWVSLLPTSTADPNWVFSIGSAEKADEESLLVRYGRAGHMLFSKTPIGQNFEVRGSFDIVSAPNKQFQAGLVMGIPNFATYKWLSFRIKRHDLEGDLVSVGLGWSTQEVSQHVTLSDKTNSFLFRLSGGKFTAVLNGDTVYEDAVLPAQIGVSDENYRVGLGAFSDSDDTLIRYNAVQIRTVQPSEDPK